MDMKFRAGARTAPNWHLKACFTNNTFPIMKLFLEQSYQPMTPGNQVCPSVIPEIRNGSKGSCRGTAELQPGDSATVCSPPEVHKTPSYVQNREWAPPTQHCVGEAQADIRITRVLRKGTMSQRPGQDHGLLDFTGSPSTKTVLSPAAGSLQNRLRVLRSVGPSQRPHTRPYQW